MKSATDLATDSAVLADMAKPGRQYYCAICNARVVLRIGTQRVPHFAHALREADPDCENYFGPGPVGLTRHYFGGADQARGRTPTPWTLFFEQSPHGPQLYVWLPPSEGTGDWSGKVVIKSTGTTRSLTSAHLAKGKLVRLRPFDGRWEIADEGRVSNEYLERIPLGHGALEGALNLFDAARAPGRYIGRNGLVRLGEPFWAITRDDSFSARCPSQKIRCEKVADAGGWTVFLVTAPTDCPRDVHIALQQWIDHPVRFPRARVWIETPLPVALSPFGDLVFPSTSNSAEVRADQAMDLEIVSSPGGAVVATKEDALQLSWERPTPGIWAVRANGVEFLRFEVRATPPASPGPLDVRVGGRQFSSLWDLRDWLGQGQHVSVDPVTLGWSDPAVGRCIRVNGSRLDIDDDCLGLELAIRPGLSIDAGPLGIVSAPVRPRSGSDSIPDDLADLATWLLTVSSTQANPYITLQPIPDRLHQVPLLSALAAARWPSHYAAHVQACANRIQDLE